MTGRPETERPVGSERRPTLGFWAGRLSSSSSACLVYSRGACSHRESGGHSGTRPPSQARPALGQVLHLGAQVRCCARPQLSRGSRCGRPCLTVGARRLLPAGSQRVRGGGHLLVGGPQLRWLPLSHGGPHRTGWAWGQARLSCGAPRRYTMGTLAGIEAAEGLTVGRACRHMTGAADDTNSEPCRASPVT